MQLKSVFSDNLRATGAAISFFGSFLVFDCKALACFTIACLQKGITDTAFSTLIISVVCDADLLKLKSTNLSMSLRKGAITWAVMGGAI